LKVSEVGMKRDHLSISELIDSSNGTKVASVCFASIWRNKSNASRYVVLVLDKALMIASYSDLSGEVDSLSSIHKSLARSGWGSLEEAQAEIIVE